MRKSTRKSDEEWRSNPSDPHTECSRLVAQAEAVAAVPVLQEFSEMREKDMTTKAMYRMTE
jgi:hypothetical protein